MSKEIRLIVDEELYKKIKEAKKSSYFPSLTSWIIALIQKYFDKK
jgi:hypothetical protein